MARPPHPLGTTGNVRTYRTRSGWRARTTYRDFDGVTREVQRHGRTEAAAKRPLAEAVRDRHRSDAGAIIGPETRVDALSWLRRGGQKSSKPTTPPAPVETIGTVSTGR